MLIYRITTFVLLVAAIGATLLQWHLATGFAPLDERWWSWLLKVIVKTGSMPDKMLYPVIWSLIGFLVALVVAKLVTMRPSTRSVHGNKDARNTHGSARWAKWGDVRRAGLTKDKGVMVGGWKGTFKTKPLRHDGPEHLLCFAPTRSGKGVSLVLPTLLTWMESVLVLDIKGENYALSAGWRAAIGQRVIRFDPASNSGSDRYNPLTEVRVGTDHEIADCQNIALMIIDTDGKGLRDYWKEGGWEWLSACVLHVLYRVQRYDGRTASLADIRTFLAVGSNDDDGGELSKEDSSFDQLLNDMAQFDHGRPSVDAEVRQCASDMFKKASSERSGVHSSAKVKLALYSDPIIATNTSESDFRISDLMNADHPTSLYIIISPSNLVRLRPLLRIIMNQFLSRLTDEMAFEGGAVKKHYNHRLLLLLDEFTSIGKLEIFEKGLGFIAGYGLKAYIFIQDLAQLHGEYGRDESITSNCQVETAFTPNKSDTAKYLSEKTGKTTIVQKKRSKSHGKSGASVSDSISEVGRQLLTSDECRSMPIIRKNIFGRTVPGDMLIFTAGCPAIYGRQRLYFQNRVLKNRAALDPPKMKRQTMVVPAPEREPSPGQAPYQAALNQVREAS